MNIILLGLRGAMAKNSGAREDRLDSYLKRAVAIVTILGIPAGLYGYFSNRHDKQVENALTFYKMFKDNETQNNWRLLVERFNDKAEDIQKAIKENNHEELQSLTVSLIQSDVNMRIAFNQVSSLFDEAAACAGSGLCDYNTIFSLMRDPAYEMAGIYGAYIEHVRKKYQNSLFGTGLYQIRSMKLKFSIF